jgi:hypothetical protein
LGTRFEVRSSARLSEAFSLVLDQKFDLIVVFPEAASWREFAEFIARQSPKKNIIAVTRTGDESPAWAEAVVPLGKGPFELLKVCADRFGIVMRSKSSGYSNRSFKKVVSISSANDSA